jgi:hypothetical protein
MRIIIPPMDTPTEAEILAARVDQMKCRIDALEADCSTSAEQRETLLRLKRALEAARVRLKSLDTQ